MGEQEGCEFSVFLCRVSVKSDEDVEANENVAEKTQPNAELEANDIGGETGKSGDVLPKTHACDFPGCNAKFSRPWKLSAHRCTHTGERPYKCKVVGCNKSYTNLTHLRRHEHNTHSEEKTECKTMKISNTKRLPLIRCDHYGCCRLLAKQENLKKHICKNHNNVESAKEVKCPDCEEVFTDRNRLRCHMFTHDGVLPFKCELCYRSFRYQYEVTKHVRKHKTYTCSFEDCPDIHKYFATYNELRAHLVQVHPSRFTCDVCDKVFSLKCRLNSHRLSCGTERNKKMYKCLVEDCDHTFKFYRNMLQHIKHKHQSPLFTCTVEDCKKSFVWKISLKKHISTVHNSDVASVAEEDKNVKTCQPRKRRKDANIPKHSVAELLSGVVLDKETTQKLILKENVDGSVKDVIMKEDGSR